MEIEKAKRIDSIYEEVSNYDLVLTVDAPLADALNSRIDGAREGLLAATPMRLAYGETEDIDFRRDLFLKIIEKTDMPWKQASYLLDAALECWQDTGELNRILRYEKFDSEEMREVLEVLSDSPNPFAAMERYEVDPGKDVAVVGEYMFDELDRRVIPDEYDSFEVLTEESFTLPDFRIFSSTTEIVEALRRNIDQGNAGRVAIVMSPESRYRPLVESMLNSEEIPYNTSTDYSEDEDLRTFVNLLRASFSRGRLRVRDVQPVLKQLSIEASEVQNNRYLEDLESDRVEEFRLLLNMVENLTFSEVLDRYEEIKGREHGFREVLEDVGLEDEKVSRENLSRLEYYLDSFDLPVDTVDQGVLLVSPDSAAYVDRPVVFHLGMDSEWMRETGGNPWSDEEYEEQRNLKDFQVLIQNGERNYYMVQDREYNEEVQPCFYFNDLMDVESFTDFPHERYQSPPDADVSSFQKEEVEAEENPPDLISQSRLNRLVHCPRAYYFSRLVADTEQEYLVKGNLFHDFAEFYVSHPGFVDEKGVDVFVEKMVAEISPYVEDLDLEELRTEFRIGIQNIRSFIDSRDLGRQDPEGYSKTDMENFFAAEFDREIRTRITELEFNDDGIGVTGKVDLLLDENHLVDYKSSTYARSPSKIVKQSNVDLYEDEPDFQPILYLLQHRRKNPGEKIKFSYVYFLQNINDEVQGDGDSEENVVTLTYYPVEFSEKMEDIEVFEYLIRGVAQSNDRRKTLEKLTWPDFRNFFQERNLPDFYEKDEVKESDLAEEFVSYARERVGDYKYVEKGCMSALSKLVEFRTTNYFREDLDRFEEFLEKQLENLEEYRETRFPVGDADLDETRYRDMIVR
ncbi:MAG: PD-(D/E)XK nuclease family protein [Candidatus Nanohaloarchaea archaeon]